ncbi:MAG TPA: outer membrane protein assembly factor BamE [Rhodanobacteraceae bacterium]
MRKLFLILTCTLMTMAMAGCGMVYHPPLQQGNWVNKKAVDQLKPGMTKRQVIALLGAPAIASPFDHKRWDYVQELELHGGKLQIHRMTLFFNNDTLVRTEGSLFAANNTKMLKQAKMYDKAGVENGKGDKSDGSGD